MKKIKLVKNDGSIQIIEHPDLDNMKDILIVENPETWYAEIYVDRVVWHRQVPFDNDIERNFIGQTKKEALLLQIRDILKNDVVLDNTKQKWIKTCFEEYTKILNEEKNC